MWLRQRSGKAPLERDPLTPASQLLPTDWDGSYESAGDLFERLCHYMLVDPARVKLGYYSGDIPLDGMGIPYEHSYAGPAGLFSQGRDGRMQIAVDDAGLNHPPTLVATMCHELAHVHLHAAKQVPAESEEEEECLTDLLTVYMGAGIFTANAAFRFDKWGEASTGHGWRASRQGYLSETLLAYSLACYGWLRGETSPAWGKHLQGNVLYYFEDSVHFLRETRDTQLPAGERH